MSKWLEQCTLMECGAFYPARFGTNILPNAAGIPRAADLGRH
jgi:hypothetical protein